MSQKQTNKQKTCQEKPQNTCIQLCHWLEHTAYERPLEPYALCQDDCLGGDDPRTYKEVGTVCDAL